jgi:DNA-binding beta-propeller fold protein YncE
MEHVEVHIWEQGEEHRTETSPPPPPLCQKKTNFVMKGTSNHHNTSDTSNPISKATPQQQSPARSFEEYDYAIQFCNDCKVPLCDTHVSIHQMTKNHFLVPIGQVSKDQQHDSIECKETDKTQEESVHMASNDQSLSNVLQKHACFFCCDQLSTIVETTNGDELPFHIEQCLEQYKNNNNNKNRNQNLDLSLIPEEVIDHVIMPLIDVKAMHYLKCTNSMWRKKIKEYREQLIPMFQFIAKFGSQGSDNGQFNGPYFITTDKQDNIYISDYNNHRIQIFDSNGQWKQSIGSNGSENGQFRYPLGILFNSRKHMYVVDGSNHRVQVFDQKMQFIMTFGSEGNENGRFQYPRGISVDADDNIVVTDCWNHRIQTFSKDGNWKQTIGKYGSGGGKFDTPWGVAVSKADGRIYVSDEDNNCIQVFSSDGKFLFKFGSEGSKNGQFRCPYGLAFSNCSQYLLVCDCGNHRIQLFDAMNGEFVKCYGSYGSDDGQFNCPTGIYISPTGQIIVTEARYGGNQQRVQIFE